MKSVSAPMPSAANFIRNIVEADLAHGRYASRRWAGKPGLGATHAEAAPDAAKIRTRFPPEPNGYLHFGHAKSICLNFGLAEQFGGRCHMRFDDTNPEKEETEYVEAIIGAVRWLGFDWQDDQEDNLYYASDYFPQMLACAEYLIAAGHAYIDSQSAEEMRQNRGTLTEPGRDSPWRNRDVAENQALFRRMRAGEFPDGAHVLRARIDMASPNINLRDPAIYRIRHASHHRTGDAYCVYPMYTFAHPIEDALENVTHSICTLEFEDQRPFYDWLLERLAEGGLFLRPLPRQYEFSRLNLTYVLLSKRKLIQLVEERHVSGWDDPRMPTLVGARRRGYAPQGFRLLMERIGVSKSDSLIDYGLLEDCMREVMNEMDERRIAVLDPVKLVITNYPEGQKETCRAPNHPLKPELGKRDLPFAREVWIERDDFREVSEKGYNRLYPGNLARLKYAYVVKCAGCEKDAEGKVTTVFCEYLPDTLSGTPGADSVKVKGNLHWVAVDAAHAAEVRLYDRLFAVSAPGAGEKDFSEDLNPDSCKRVVAQLEPSLKDAEPERRFQFERHGYFAVDPKDSRPGSPIFNRAVTLRDSWGSGRQT
ncbi:MAG: glutamine--tRNA ligase/YqeY domain fusion protein [Zoogloeaceae bacterium]|jgi:glutaminyl-tRNA synthetase|nr:glutamine--tRNA ligase/YqeY domain fusion protein [Zoogloeaceae bacterium]